MQLLKKNGILLFWLILFADCYFLFEKKYDYHTYLKITLVPILMFYVFLNARKKHFIRSKTLAFLGMICAWIGDILLINSGDNFFITGMIAFLGTHIFYSIFLYRLQPINNTTSYEVTIIAALILSVIFFQYFKFMKDDIERVPDFKIPIYIYCVAIGIMTVLAANIYSNAGKRNMSLQFFIPGALLFIASDAILLIHKLKYSDEDFLPVLVMLTYGYGQCLLAQGFTKYLKG